MTSKFIEVTNTKGEKIGIPSNCILSMKETQSGFIKYTRITRNDRGVGIDASESVSEIVSRINAVKL